MFEMENNMQLGDLSVLDQLKEIRGRIETLDSRLKAMEEKRGQVADQVYVRVRSDYASQREQLVAEAAPMKVRGRELYGQLQGELVKLDEAFEEHRLAQEEIELRHTLGEFTDQEFAQRKKLITDELGSRKEAREQAMAVRARFVEAFGSERELEAVPHTPAPQPIPASSATVQVAPVPAPPAHVVMPTAPIHTPPAMEIPPPRADTAPVAPMPPPQAQVATQLAPPPAPAPVPAPSTSPVSKRGNPDGTLVFRPGRLIPLNSEAGMAPTTLSLKPIVIGSDNSCDIRLSHNGIARRQCEIIMSRAGFNLKDVGGGNIVLVNGQPVTERILEDGDTVQVGAAQFQFKRG